MTRMAGEQTVRKKYKTDAQERLFLNNGVIGLTSLVVVL